MSRRLVLGATLVLLNVPITLALIDGISFHARNRSNHTLISLGKRREYLLYVPKSYDRATPTPLVISLDAAALWGAAQRETSRWNDIADREGFIVVYPSGSKDDGSRIWHVETGAHLTADVEFIANLIDTLTASYHIDPNRVYANGLSNGGGMSFVLSCAMPDRIAAVGMVAAAQTLPWEWCADRGPMPMIAFHGTADRQVPYKGGSTSQLPTRRRFPNALAWTANWARRNRCSSNPVDAAIAATVIRRSYENCADDASVVLYTIDGGGHTWPGGTPLPEWWLGKTTTDIDASNEMWKFFREHPLRRGRAE